MTAIPDPLTRARAAMKERGVDAVLAGSPGLVAFLTGHVMPAHLAYPSRDGRLEKPTLSLVTLDDAVTIGTAPKPLHGRGVPYAGERYGLSDDAFEVVATSAHGLGLEHARLAAELSWVPAGATLTLVRRLPGLQIEPLDDLLRDAKAQKSEWEVEGIRAACALADAAQLAVREAVRAGVTELELYSEASRAMNVLTDELVLVGCELQVGSRGELMMGGPTNARLRPGELVMADIYPRHPNGWWADSCSTVLCGEPDGRLRTDWQALHDGLRSGAETLRPGVAAVEVYDAIARYAGDQPGHAGHGIGRDHYEEPVISATSNDRLDEGSVVVLEPGRYGSGRGMRLEWAFRVTRDGGEPITTFALEL